MGIAEINQQTIIIHSNIITYGNAADDIITERIRREIETMWNEPEAVIKYRGDQYRVIFRITAACQPTLEPLDVISNTDPLNNYFRIEEKAMGNISFVDGLGSNTGYFQLDNLYEGSTTAAHEYGHTLGLEHPYDMDYRGKGVPGIMYPRGTMVDPEFQYNPLALSGDGSNGGTMHPQNRKVNQHDIHLLDIPGLPFKNGQAVIGDFSSVWHPDHASLR